MICPNRACLPKEDWLPAERLSEEFKAVGFYLSGHPLDDYMAALKRTEKVLTLDEVTAKAASGALVAKMAGTVAGRQERKSARGNRFAFVQLSDPTGQYEVTMFSDTLEAARDHLETGNQIVIQVEATMEAEQLKLLGRSVMLADMVVANAGSSGLRVFLGDVAAISTVSDILQGAIRDNVKGGRGPVTFTIDDIELGEIDVELETQFPVNPQIKGALRSLGGVIEVQEI